MNSPQYHGFNRQPQSPLPIIPKKEKEKKTGSVAFIISLLFHGGILLMIGGIVLIPAAIQKSAFTADPNMAIPQDAAMEEPPDTSDQLNELPPSDVPQENMQVPDQSAPASNVDVVIAREDSSANSAWASSLAGTISVDVANTNGFQKSSEGNSAEKKTSVGSRITLFGSTEKTTGDSLEGYFYDLKQTSDQKPSDIGKMFNDKVDYAKMSVASMQAVEGQVVKAELALKQIIASGFKREVINKYFKAPNPLYASQWFFPIISANEAPKLFGVEKIVQPRLWFILYTGMWKAPETMTFRFVGNAGEFLVVNMNGGLVLDACHSHVTSTVPITDWKPKDNIAKYHIFADGMWKKSEFFTFGDWISVKKDQVYPLKILIGERNGGNFCTFLFYQKQGEPIKTDSSNRPILSIFRTSDNCPRIPNFDKNTEGPPYR